MNGAIFSYSGKLYLFVAHHPLELLMDKAPVHPGKHLLPGTQAPVPELPVEEIPIGGVFELKELTLPAEDQKEGDLGRIGLLREGETINGLAPKVQNRLEAIGLATAANADFLVQAFGTSLRPRYQRAKWKSRILN